MFTKINKVLLWLLIIGGIIASIGMGTIPKMGWLIPVGIISTFVLAAGFGMLIEISENIRDSRDYLYEIKNKMSGSYSANNAQQPVNPNYGTTYHISDGESKNYGNALSKFSAINNGGSADTAPDFWYCTECSTKNDRLASSCKGCGKYK